MTVYAGGVGTWGRFALSCPVIEQRRAVKEEEQSQQVEATTKEGIVLLRVKAILM
jgi:hypothetical protein